jgi:hypothetical protein
MSHKQKHRVISNNSKCEFEVTKENIYEEHQEVQNDLSKMIVRPWEELQFNKNRHGLGYDKGNNFHIPDYSKPVQFVSAGFLDENLKTLEVNEEVKNVDDTVDDKNIEKILDKCQHCHRVGHMENQCFDLHPCLHCGKTNHHSDKCQKKKKDKKKNSLWLDKFLVMESTSQEVA